MTPERLAEIKAMAQRYSQALWQHTEASFCSALGELIAEAADNERLRAELRERCEYLECNQFTFWDELKSAYRCWVCGNTRRNDHAPDCRHARLMKFPEKP